MRKVLYSKLHTVVHQITLEVDDNATEQEVKQSAKLLSDLNGWDHVHNTDVKEWIIDINEDTPQVKNPIYD